MLDGAAVSGAEHQGDSGALIASEVDQPRKTEGAMTLPNMDDQPLVAQITAYTDDPVETSRLMDAFGNVWPDAGITFQSGVDETTGAAVTLFNILQIV